MNGTRPVVQTRRRWVLTTPEQRHGARGRRASAETSRARRHQSPQTRNTRPGGRRNGLRFAEWPPCTEESSCVGIRICIRCFPVHDRTATATADKT